MPTLATDAIDISGIWNDDDILLTQRIIDPDGKTLQQMSALTAGLLKNGVGKKLGKPESGYRYLWNTAGELRYVTELLHARTDGYERWREDEYRDPPTPKTQLPFPLSPSVKTQALVDIPSALHGRSGAWPQRLGQGVTIKERWWVTLNHSRDGPCRVAIIVCQRHSSPIIGL
jgi:hypothetical protein